jgi:predicted enzyme related to lactoylglutathione lyase
MRTTGITSNVRVADIAAASEFYRDYLGLIEQPLGLDWVTRFVSEDGRAMVQLVTGDASAPEDSVMSVHAGADVDDAYAEAQRRGYEIVYPLTTEPWGIRRFFVRDPGGNVLNITSHPGD